MQAAVTVEGLPVLEAKLRALGIDVRAALKDAAERAMLPFEARVKEGAPAETGNYRDSWTTKVAEEGDAVVAITGTSLLVDAPGAPGSGDFPLGIYLEYGTGIYAENGDGRDTPWSYVGSDGEWHTTVGMAARPHVRPAFDEERDKIAGRVRDDLAKAIDRAAR